MAMAQRNVDLPSLKLAVNEMSAAEKQLSEMDVVEGVSAEQRGLEQLIRARQNIRQYLSQSSSSSQCRQVDQQQHEKLRQEESKKKDQKQQLAEARQSLEKLAEREREWAEQSQQACSASSASASSPSATPSSENSETTQPNDASSSSSSSSSSNAKPTLSQLAESQQQMKDQLTKLAEQLRELDEASRTTDSAVQQAAQLQDRALKSLQQQEGVQSSQAAREAAERLEQLSRHLAGMNAQDLRQRLKEARQASEQASARQQQLQQQMESSSSQGSSKDENAAGESSDATSESDAGTNPSSSGAERSQLVDAQRGGAMQMEMLAELLEGIRADAASEEGELRAELDRLRQEMPPGEIARQMRSVADKLEAQDTKEASREAGRAADRTRELARQLARVQAEAAQPQLDDLLELEQQLSKWIEQTDQQQKRGETSSGAQEEWRQLEDRLQAVAEDSDALAKAMRALNDPAPSAQNAEASPGGADSNQDRAVSQEDSSPQQMPEGFGSRRGLPEGGALRGVARALQAKIQEVILAGALLDMDQPIPAEYRPLVDEYYRTLSDDLQ